jgi:hypothetical protein
VGAGHALLIGIYEPSTLTSVTSSSGMPTSIISNQTLGSGSDVSAYILSNTTSGSITITANVSIEQHMWLTVVEYSNVAASPLDASAGGASTSYESTISTSNFTTTAASDMLWSLCSAPSGSPIAVGTSPITWNQVAIATGSYPPVVMVEDGVAGSAGSYSGQCTVGDSDTNIVTVALKGGGTPAAATPTFSPAAGTYSTAQTVTISDSTSGSTIYYTTNGTTPTTSSTQYTGAITVSSTETLESIATASGYSQSAVGSAAYTINSSGTIPTLSVSTSGTPSTYGGSVTFTATISSGPTGSITFYDSGVSVGSGTISGTTASYTTSTLAVGTHTITAGYAGGSGYNAVTSSAITQVVNQATQTITFGTLPGVTYGVSPITLGATASSGLAVSYSVTGPATVSGSTLTVTGTGSVTVTASQAGNSNYSAATSVQRTFAVAQAALTVTANNASRVYGASNPTFSYTITGYVNGDTSSVVSGTATETTTATTSSAVGTYPITFATESLTATNYTFSYVSGTLTISGGAMQTITFTALSSPVTYGVSPIALSASASSGLAVTFSVVSGPGTISGSTLTITGAGTVVVAANQGGNSNYAAATQVTQSVVVNQATQTITFGTLPGVTYGVSPITLGATASSGLTVSYTVTGPATVSGSTLTVTGAGSVTVTASQAGNSNYAAATSVQQSFTVAQAPLTVTANNASRAYGAANPAFSYTITGYVNGDTSGVVSGTAMETTTATTSSALGTYPITFATESLSATNYTFSYVGGTLTVSGAVATLTLSTSGTPVLYGGSVTFTATLSISSSGDTVTFRDGSTAIGAGTIQGTTATFTPDPTTPLTAGPHTISAVWPGNADYSSVTSNSITQTVLSTLNNCLQ